MAGCIEQSRLGVFHDGELDPLSSAEVARHLSQCAACQRELEAIRAASRLLSAPPPDGFIDQAMARLAQSGPEIVRRARESSPAQNNTTIVLPLVRLLCGMAASILVIGAAWLIEAPPHSSSVRVSQSSASTPAWERLASGEGLDSPLTSENNVLPHDAVAVDEFIRDSLNEVSPL